MTKGKLNRNVLTMDVPEEMNEGCAANSGDLIILIIY